MEMAHLSGSTAEKDKRPISPRSRAPPSFLAGMDRIGAPHMVPHPRLSWEATKPPRKGFPFVADCKLVPQSGADEVP